LPEVIARGMLDFKISLSTIILTFVFFTGGTQFDSAESVYGQLSEGLPPETESPPDLDYYPPPYSYSECLTVFSKESCDFRFNR